MGEPDEGGIVKDGAHDAPICGLQRFGREAPARPSKGFHDIEDPRGPLDTIAGVRAEGEVGVQRDTQDFRGSVSAEPLSRQFALEGGVGDLCVSNVNRVTLDFWGGNGQLFTVGPPYQYGTELVGPCLGLHDAGSRSQQSEVIVVGRHV